MGTKNELSKMVHPECMAIAMIGQTATIFAVTATTWTLMYFFSPSKSLRVKFPSLNNAYSRVEFFIQRRVDSFPSFIRSSNAVDWNRVVTSGAEAWILRKPLIPFTAAGSIAVGVKCGTAFYDWRHPEETEKNIYQDEESMEQDPDKEYMFGWNKIEHARSSWDEEDTHSELRASNQRGLYGITDQDQTRRYT